MEDEMKTSERREEASAQTGIVVHAVTAKDAATVAAMRTMIEPHRGQLQGTEARQPFDAIMERVAPAEGVTYEAGSVGGVPGWWCRPARARGGQVILHLHGGWFNWGSARAYRHLVGQIAARAGAVAFVPDYRLAPEHPFPAAVVDAQAVYQGLIADGARRIAIVGDSAGGGLGLVLLSLAKREGTAPVGAVLLSPVTDLTLEGESWEAQASTDMFFTRAQAAALVQAYLGGSAATDPKASPLFSDLAGLPPIRLHVGGDEMLLDDSQRYVARAVAAGVDARLDVWQGMQHVFQGGGIGTLAAASESLTAIGAFLAERLGGSHS
jgi:monoterpene epsilon-lactone hydrolase